MNHPQASPPQVTIDELLETHGALLLDAFGVLVNTSGALPGAKALIERLNASHHPYLVVTNDSARLPESCAAFYQSLGLAIPTEKILTSASMMEVYFRDHQLGPDTQTTVVGTADSRAYLERIGVTLTPLNPRTPVDVLAVANAQQPLLEVLADIVSMAINSIEAGRDLRILVPNPDLIFPKGDGTYGITGGSLGLVVQAALRARFGDQAPELQILGKPNPAFFLEAKARTQGLNPVMIGDQIDTDVRGARAAHIPVALASTGISSSAQSEIQPDYLLPNLL